MNKLTTFLLCLLTAFLLAGYAFADVIGGPAYAIILGVPLIVVAIIIIVAILVIRAVANAAKQKKNAEEMSCRHDDAESNARKSSWDNRDPWD